MPTYTREGVRTAPAPASHSRHSDRFRFLGFERATVNDTPDRQNILLREKLRNTTLPGALARRLNIRMLDVFLQAIPKKKAAEDAYVAFVASRGEKLPRFVREFCKVELAAPVVCANGKCVHTIDEVHFFKEADGARFNFCSAECFFAANGGATSPEMPVAHPRNREALVEHPRPVVATAEETEEEMTEEEIKALVRRIISPLVDEEVQRAVAEAVESSVRKVDREVGETLRELRSQMLETQRKANEAADHAIERVETAASEALKATTRRHGSTVGAMIPPDGLSVSPKARQQIEETVRRAVAEVAESVINQKVDRATEEALREVRSEVAEMQRRIRATVLEVQEAAAGNRPAVAQERQPSKNQSAPAHSRKPPRWFDEIKTDRHGNVKGSWWHKNKRR